jgi:hypothetical protein
MPRDRKTPHEQAQLDAANRRARWLDAFNAAVVKLRPHLADAGKYLQTVGTVELSRAGVDSDPKAVAKAWHEGQQPPTAQR